MGRTIVDASTGQTSFDPADVPAFITPEQALSAWRANAFVTDIQFALAAVVAQMITAEEAEAWVARGELPAVALAAIAVLPAEIQVAARIRFSGARTIARLDPFVVGPLKAVTGLSDEELDAFFQGASQI